MTPRPPAMMLALLLTGACSTPATSGWQGDWEVVTWAEELYPLWYSNWDESDDTFSTITWTGTMRVDDATMVVELESSGVGIDRDGSEEDLARLIHHEGEILESSASTFEVGMLEEGETRPYLMLCSMKLLSLLVCEEVVAEYRYPSVFKREAP